MCFSFLLFEITGIAQSEPTSQTTKWCTIKILGKISVSWRNSISLAGPSFWVCTSVDINMWSRAADVTEQPAMLSSLFPSMWVLGVKLMVSALAVFASTHSLSIWFCFYRQSGDHPYMVGHEYAEWFQGDCIDHPKFL